MWYNRDAKYLLKIQVRSSMYIYEDRNRKECDFQVRSRGLRERVAGI